MLLAVLGAASISGSRKSAAAIDSTGDMVTDMSSAGDLGTSLLSMRLSAVRYLQHGKPEVRADFETQAAKFAEAIAVCNDSFSNPARVAHMKDITAKMGQYRDAFSEIERCMGQMQDHQGDRRDRVPDQSPGPQRRC